MPGTRARVALGIVVLVLFSTGVGWWFVHQSGKASKQAASSPTAPTSPATDQKSIAVLPFVNMSADKADEYLSDGMTEELLHMLTQVPGLRVPGRSSGFAFKGRTEGNIFRKVGEQLRVNTVLEGSVRKAGDKLRICWGSQSLSTLRPLAHRAALPGGAEKSGPRPMSAGTEQHGFRK